jgi:hypothetical protein
MNMKLERNLAVAGATTGIAVANALRNTAIGAKKVASFTTKVARNAWAYVVAGAKTVGKSTVNAFKGIGEVGKQELEVAKAKQR